MILAGVELTLVLLLKGIKCSNGGTFIHMCHSYLRGVPPITGPVAGAPRPRDLATGTNLSITCGSEGGWEASK